MNAEIKFFGVRGSAPLSGKEYLEFGGNTTSITVRTPSNSLMFLDAGSGLFFAQEELNQKADKLWLLLSHTHADHINGLGLSNIVRLEDHPIYTGEKIHLVGPKNVAEGMKKYYDADRIWPVSFNPSDRDFPNLPDIEYDNILEFKHNFQKIKIDQTTILSLHEGNHPVKDGVILFRFDFTTIDGPTSLVFATDNEFGFNHKTSSFSELEDFKSSYIKFIRDCNLLVADAQYSKDDYQKHKGFGHSYPEEVLEIAREADVKKLILTHHHSYSDEIQNVREKNLRHLMEKKNCEFSAFFAKEKTKFIIK